MNILKTTKSAKIFQMEKILWNFLRKLVLEQFFQNPEIWKLKTFGSGLLDGIFQNGWKVIKALFGTKNYSPEIENSLDWKEKV
jgi:hypothetical protein